MSNRRLLPSELLERRIAQVRGISINEVRAKYEKKAEVAPEMNAARSESEGLEL